MSHFDCEILEEIFFFFYCKYTEWLGVCFRCYLPRGQSQQSLMRRKRDGEVEGGRVWFVYVDPAGSRRQQANSHSAEEMLSGILQPRVPLQAG